ncbi:hypothetical protein RclHR1_04360019 [Rhizophagus clarus]|uniref:HAT C-terminal dimerisation domain-containing protein n=1 Tax=Rhizophagus clarus TaxID=94130 RepID=A0A2Z6RI92_9GLOM|nr:hypothetical protein RclHR1_04360019 [Rhizophagus clarus]
MPLNLAIQYIRPQSAPVEASTSTSNNTNKIYLNKDICKILLDNNWRKNDRTTRKTVVLMGAAIIITLFYAPLKISKRPTCLLLDFEDYRQKIEPFNNKTFNQFGDDVFKFWKYVEENYKELASIALRIFRICVNAVSVERMWSSIGFLHTNHCNRLNNDKVLSMSKLHASINFSFRKKELQKNKIKFLDLNAKPVDDNLQQNPANNDDDFDEIIGDEDNIITSEC